LAGPLDAFEDLGVSGASSTIAAATAAATDGSSPLNDKAVDLMAPGAFLARLGDFFALLTRDTTAVVADGEEAPSETSVVGALDVGVTARAGGALPLRGAGDTAAALAILVASPSTTLLLEALGMVSFRSMFSSLSKDLMHADSSLPKIC